MAKHVFLITGSPGSGKTTYAREHAGENDIIFDLDDINQALSGSIHAADPAGLDVALAMRSAAITEIAKKSGKWQNAYFITAASDRSEIDKLRYMLGAEEIPITTSLEDCKRNILQDETRPDKAGALALAEAWHKNTNPQAKDTRDLFSDWFNASFG